MQLEQRPSGLIAPAEPPKPPEPVPPGTIKHEEERELARKGLRLIAQAMRLNSSGGIVLPDARKPYHWALFNYACEVLLGEPVALESW